MLWFLDLSTSYFLNNNILPFHKLYGFQYLCFKKKYFYNELFSYNYFWKCINCANYEYAYGVICTLLWVFMLGHTNLNMLAPF